MGKDYKHGQYKMSAEEFKAKTMEIMNKRKANKVMRIIETVELDESPLDTRRYVLVATETNKQ